MLESINSMWERKSKFILPWADVMFLFYVVGRQFHKKTTYHFENITLNFIVHFFLSQNGLLKGNNVMCVDTLHVFIPPCAHSVCLWVVVYDRVKNFWWHTQCRQLCSRCTLQSHVQISFVVFMDGGHQTRTRINPTLLTSGLTDLSTHILINQIDGH